MTEVAAGGRRIRYRAELLSGLVRREVLGRYRGSLFGVAWSLLAPVLMLVVYTIAFHELLGARWPGVDGRAGFAAMVFAGLLMHGMLAEVLVRAPVAVAGQPNFVTRVVFPLALLPLVPVGAALVHSLLGLLVLATAAAFAGPGLHATAVLVPVVLLPFVVMLSGLAWLLGAIGVYVRDISQLGGVLATVLLFLSPVFFPVDTLPDPYRQWVAANPLAWVVEAVRGLMFDGTLPAPGATLAYSASALVVAAAGLAVFRRLRPGFGDVL